MRLKRNILVDKYLYLPYAINILQVRYKPDVTKHFIHLEIFHNTTDDEIFNTIKQYEAEINEHIICLIKKHRIEIVETPFFKSLAYP
jgi:hypothetical protein